jgi:hypothetical protein
MSFAIHGYFEGIVPVTERFPRLRGLVVFDDCVSFDDGKD